jgi:TonB family protein
MAFRSASLVWSLLVHRIFISHDQASPHPARQRAVCRRLNKGVLVMTLRFFWPLLVMTAALGLPARGAWGADTPCEPPSGQAEPASLDVGTNARSLETKVRTRYPPEALSKGQEGWVILSYTVGTDGTVVDPIVEDSSGVAAFEKAAIRSASKYRYSPATWNGKPVEQCATEVQFNFAIVNDGDKKRRVARRSFAKTYRATVALVEEKRMAEAEAALDEMMTKGAWTNYESSKLWLLKAIIQASNGDKAGQLRSLKRAAFSNGDYIDPQYYRTVLRSIFGLQVEQKQYQTALKTYADLHKLEPVTEDPELAKAAAQVRDVINGPDAVLIPGVVENRTGSELDIASWQHELLRRKFAFNDIEGDVGRFELRCDWKRVVDEVSTEKAWEVPVDWGWCQMFVFGEIGAKLTLVEYPLAEAQKGIDFEPRLTN